MDRVSRCLSGQVRLSRPVLARCGQDRRERNHLTGWNQEPTDLALGRNSPKGGEKMGLGGNTFRKPCLGPPGQWEGLAHPLLPAWAKQKG